MYNYCTLFDSHYLTRGLAMFESLKKHSDEFHLYVFAFDDKCFKVLNELNYKEMTVISLIQFEDKALLSVKSERTKAEYCWTCTPSVIKYAIEQYTLDSCTYLDADLYFFSNPKTLIDEMDSASVLLTEHRYTPEYDQSATSGIYCVQFMTFKNDGQGMNVLCWWREACIEWCFARFEEGKFGDQKYLDDWPNRFEGIHVLKHLGGGVAPWNIQQYDLLDKNFELVFYHFHNFKYFSERDVEFGTYRLNDVQRSMLYKPYLQHLENIRQDIEHINSDCEGDHISTSRIMPLWKRPFSFFKRKIKGNYNIYKIKDILEV